MSCVNTCVRPTPSQAHCGACHVTFSGLTLFDRHRRGSTFERHCARPETMTDRSLPLRQDASGVWRSSVIRDSTGSGTPQTAENGSGVVPDGTGVLSAAETISGSAA